MIFFLISFFCFYKQLLTRNNTLQYKILNLYQPYLLLTLHLLFLYFLIVSVYWYDYIEYFCYRKQYCCYCCCSYYCLNYFCFFGLLASILLECLNYFLVFGSLTTIQRAFCVFEPEGAWFAASINSNSTSSGTSSDLMRRIARQL